MKGMIYLKRGVFNSQSATSIVGKPELWNPFCPITTIGKREHSEKLLKRTIYSLNLLTHHSPDVCSTACLVYQAISIMHAKMRQ
jgi:hypothetical protein